MNVDWIQPPAEENNWSPGLAGSVHCYDPGHSSRYDLCPHRAVDVASGAYDPPPTTELKVMQTISPRPVFATAIECDEGRVPRGQIVEEQP